MLRLFAPACGGALFFAPPRRPAPAIPRLLEARDRLWCGQANDAYWHGVFGGCYLPHLRRAVRSALIASEDKLAEAGAIPALGWERDATMPRGAPRCVSGAATSR
jgi:hypothetical protein